ncbi:hypothetical protein [uncultured Hymenobacter sp.]|uniref:hypothetical protein n=1 Tax=uncultured Hymenobacter sp. TaxID=170016 RepID=UPI0035CB05EE
MFRHLFLLRRWLAMTFLVVFVNVLAGQCYCASRQQLASATRPAPRPTAKPAPMLPGHACCRARAARNAPPAPSLLAAVASAAPEAPGKSGGADNCCRQKAATLLAALDAPAAKQPLSAAPALLPEALSFGLPARATQSWDRTAPGRLLPSQHLPPKIPDLRIFLRSLTV